MKHKVEPINVFQFAVRNCKPEFDIKALIFPYPSFLACWQTYWHREILRPMLLLLFLASCCGVFANTERNVRQANRQIDSAAARQDNNVCELHKHTDACLCASHAGESLFLDRWLAFLIGNKLIPFNELKNIVYLCVSCKLLKLRMPFPVFFFESPCC